MKDRFGRTVDYMRISLTDRCNLRCRYCMPAEGIKKAPRSSILTYEEILRICRVAAGLGITKFKITGGEPLVRCGCVSLVRSVKALPAVEQVTMTTNGQELVEVLDELAAAGIDAINISLDTLRDDRYEYITRIGSLDRTLAAIRECVGRGIKTKLNCLIQKGFNDDEILELADFALGRDMDIRFIEMMPIGCAGEYSGVSDGEILGVLRRAYGELEPDTAEHGNGPARYYRLPGRSGAIGLIGAVHDPFCSSCNRIRLSSQGIIKPCLCYEHGVDLRPHLAGSDDELRSAIEKAIEDKPERHCFDADGAGERRSMAQIGG